MIPKIGNRFSEKIMLSQKRVDFIRGDHATELALTPIPATPYIAPPVATGMAE
jgi:hypothetical protein